MDQVDGQSLAIIIIMIFINICSTIKPFSRKVSIVTAVCSPKKTGFHRLHHGYNWATELSKDTYRFVSFKWLHTHQSVLEDL